jgi:hypothetical protein
MGGKQLHHCSACGKKGHTIKTCRTSQASKILKLQEALRKAMGSRPKRRRNQRLKRRPAAFGALRKQRSTQYSGANAAARRLARRRAVTPRSSKRGEANVVDKVAEVQLQACKRLATLGFISIPVVCPSCGSGHLSEPAVQPGRCKTAQVEVRCDNCDDCRKRFNVLTYTPFHNQLGRGFTCDQLLRLLRYYAQASMSAPPTPSQGAFLVSTSHQCVDKVFGKLRAAECAAAHKENLTMVLGNDVTCQRNIETDGTLLRSVPIGLDNPHYQEELCAGVAAWRKRTGRRNPPRVWQLQLRVAGLTERGGGRTTLARLPSRAVSLTDPPPPEAAKEIAESGILSRCTTKANLYADGAHAWKLAVAAHNKKHKTNMMVKNVAHYKQEYTNRLRHVRRGASKIGGTQAMDQRWRWLKKFVPHSLHNRDHRQVNSKIWEYVFSWQWRTNQLSLGNKIIDNLAAILK